MAIHLLKLPYSAKAMNLGPDTRTVYNPRGILRPLLREPLRHLLRLGASREYRFLQYLHYLRWMRGGGHPGAVRFGGTSIGYVDLPSLLSAWDEIFVNKIYDFGDVGATQPYMIDAGANIGLACLYWQLRYPGFQGIAFEPDPQIARVLGGNVAGWKAAVEIDNAALGGTEGEAAFLRDGADAGRVVPGETNADGGLIQVRVKRLSRYLDRDVSFLKIDIEGAELEVLEEIRSRLACVQRIFVECHSFTGRRQDYGAVIHLLQDAGFRCQVRVARSMGELFRAGPAVPGAHDLNLNVSGTKL